MLFAGASGDGNDASNAGEAAKSVNLATAFGSDAAAVTITSSSSCLGVFLVAAATHSFTTAHLKLDSALVSSIGQFRSIETRPCSGAPPKRCLWMCRSSSRSSLSCSMLTTVKSTGKSRGLASCTYFTRPLSGCKVNNNFSNIASCPSVDAAFKSFSNCSVVHSFPSVACRSASTAIFSNNPSWETSAAAKADASTASCCGLHSYASSMACSTQIRAKPSKASVPKPVFSSPSRTTRATAMARRQRPSGSLGAVSGLLPSSAHVAASFLKACMTSARTSAESLAVTTRCASHAHICANALKELASGDSAECSASSTCNRSAADGTRRHRPPSSLSSKGLRAAAHSAAATVGSEARGLASTSCMSRADACNTMSRMSLSHRSLRFLSRATIALMRSAGGKGAVSWRSSLGVTSAFLQRRLSKTPGNSSGTRCPRERTHSSATSSEDFRDRGRSAASFGSTCSATPSSRLRIACV
mmetsp:Transcript_30627/g.81479  ORF Transcript_30627/g.81479 Transcript_30627/m.81479 type:complete len:473 (+) Transcript_30627:1533-2951(+)